MTVEMLAKSHSWNLPAKCPICGSKLVINSNLTKITCDNENCKSYLSGRILKWVNKLNINEWALVTIEKFIDAGLIDSLSSIYSIDWSIVEKMEGFGKKSVDNMRNNLMAVKSVTLAQFIAGYNIAGLGEKQIQKIIDAKNYTTVDDFAKSKYSDFICDGIGEITAKKLEDGIKAFYDDMLTTLKYVSIKTEEKKVASGKFGGKSYCFTGTASRPRKELQAMVIDNGGVVFDSVKKGLDYLVIADPNSASSKAVKARKDGVILISEEEFVSSLN